jgi:hypothetical protein
MSLKACPLKRITIKRDVNDSAVVFDLCYGDRCAWYIKETAECAIKCVATRLETGHLKIYAERVE